MRKSLNDARISGWSLMDNMTLPLLSAIALAAARIGTNQKRYRSLPPANMAGQRRRKCARGHIVLNNAPTVRFLYIVN